MLHHQLAFGHHESGDLCGDQRQIPRRSFTALQTGAVFPEPTKIPTGIGIVQSENEPSDQVLKQAHRFDKTAK